MTNKEATKILHDIKGAGDEWDAALDMAIEAMQNPPTQMSETLGQINRDIWINEVPSAQPESARTFVELFVEYPDPELCIYKEYKGKPYYSIKYIENGKTYVGYGTYSPEVLSKYLKEYFISSAEPERKKGKWVVISEFEDCRYAKCNQCNVTQVFYYNKPLTNFCPNCGTDMRERRTDENGESN